MFDGLFDNRNRTVAELIKLGDYLGRSLRENVSIFKIDSQNNSVCYVTESHKVIVGNYTVDDQIMLENIVVEDAEVFLNEQKFDTLVDSKINSFVKNIYEDSHKKARSTFDDILYLWESRLKFKNVQDKLHEKSAKFNQTNNIIESDEFQQFLEIAPEVVNYLKANREKISKISDIRNAVRLSQTVSEAFDVPKLDYESLQDLGYFTVNEDTEKSVYEMICKQELVKKELLEHKANFDSVWASNAKVQTLAGLIYSDEKAITRALGNAMEEVPYLALASKKQITETIKNSLNLNGVRDVSLTDIQEYSSYIFEVKKPARNYLTKHLNERYGVNIQNLKEPASFKSLLNTQVVIFETLSKISPKGSVQRDVLSNLAESIKNKTGVEALDVNDVIQEIFIAAGYEHLLINESIDRVLDIEKLKIVGDILKNMGVGSSTSNLSTATPGSAATAAASMPAPTQPTQPTQTPPAPTGMDDDDVTTPQGAQVQGDEEEEVEGQQDGMEGMPEEGMEEEMPPSAMSDDDLMQKMNQIEQLLASLKSEIGGDEEAGLGSDLDDYDEMEGEEEGTEEEMPEEEMPEEEMEGEDIDDEQAELDAEEDAIEAKHGKAHEMEDEAEEEEAVVRNKQKAAEKKEDKQKKFR
jgi:hypothetical protein